MKNFKITGQKWQKIEKRKNDEMLTKTEKKKHYAVLFCSISLLRGASNLSAAPGIIFSQFATDSLTRIQKPKIWSVSLENFFEMCFKSTRKWWHCSNDTFPDVPRGLFIHGKKFFGMVFWAQHIEIYEAIHVSLVYFLSNYETWSFVRWIQWQRHLIWTIKEHKRVKVLLWVGWKWKKIVMRIR